MPLSVPVNGDKVLTEAETFDIEKDIAIISALGFKPKYVVATKAAYPKLIFDFKGDFSKARIALQEAGYDITAYRQDDRPLWQITKRTKPGTSWA